MIGTVYLVGAGPGDPELLTRRGYHILAHIADVVIYDRLVGPELLEQCRHGSEKIYVGKEAGRHAMTQDDINALLVEKAKEGKAVCRLKGGDPFVFGRGGEEALFCRAHDVPFEIVPGVSSSIAAPAYAGIPVTQRGVATSFAVVTGHTKDDDAPPPELPVADTLVFLMGVRALRQIVARLLERGESPTKPVAIVRWGTTTQQQVVTGTLETIEAEVQRSGIGPPALIVVGDVVRLRDELRWFDDPQLRPLWGQTIIVTRAREQASGFVYELKQRGARVLQCATIQTGKLDDYTLLDVTLHSLRSFDWVVFTSANGVAEFRLRLMQLKLDVRALGNSKIAAIGPGTGAALLERWMIPDYVPQTSVSEKVAEGLLEHGVAGKRVLIVKALEGREVLEQMLREGGADVTVAPVYRTLPDTSNAEAAREALEAGEVTWVTFTSSSTVKNFLAAIGEEVVHRTRPTFKVACIGPVTAQTAREMGLEPDVIAPEASVDALVQALQAS